MTDLLLNAVTVIKFGHMSSDVLAYGATYGTITVCSVSDPPSIMNKLTGHSKDVTGLINWYWLFSLSFNVSWLKGDINVLLMSFIFLISFYSDFDFSLNNQYIASSSLDKTVRVWDIPNNLCIRVIYGVTSQLCIRFHPVSEQQL